MLIEGEEEKRREDPRGAALANTGWLARGYYRRKEREGQVVGSRVVWCILGVGKQGWGCGGDGWMDGYPPSRKKKKSRRLLCWLRLREERYGCDHSFRGNHTKPQQPQCTSLEPLKTHTSALACNEGQEIINSNPSPLLYCTWVYYIEMLDTSSISNT